MLIQWAPVFGFGYMLVFLPFGQISTGLFNVRYVFRWRYKNRTNHAPGYSKENCFIYHPLLCSYVRACLHVYMTGIYFFFFFGYRLLHIVIHPMGVTVYLTTYYTIYVAMLAMAHGIAEKWIEVRVDYIHKIYFILCGVDYLTSHLPSFSRRIQP